MLHLPKNAIQLHDTIQLATLLQQCKLNFQTDLAGHPDPI